jgi:hypothetical protein
MNRQLFSLKPFPVSGDVPDLKISGNISRHSRNLAIQYELTGALKDLMIPELSDRPVRRKGLWQETCLEFFVGPDDSDQYWEFNLSPTGHWNIYHFSAYRKGMHEEPAFTSLPFAVSSQADAFLLSLKIDLEKISLSDQTLDIGISAVIESIKGELIYWALIHTATEADFHRRDAFIIQL